MQYARLKTAAEAIVMPPDMRLRIAANCKKQIVQTGKELTMKHSKPAFIRKSVIIIAAVVLCLAMSVGALAATGALEGFFEDITDWRGAVTGTAYTPAEGEIRLTAAAEGEWLRVLVAFSAPDRAPYCYGEILGFDAYRIVDAENRTVSEGHSAAAEIRDGQAEFSLPAEGLESGSYHLVISGLRTEKKADAPLEIHGSWECNFVK